MKTKLFMVFTILFTFNFVLAQNSGVKIRVKWASKSYENKIEVYNTANDLLLTICDGSQCYSTTQLDSHQVYGGKYDLGCVTNGNNYYIKLYDAANNGWGGSSFVSVKVDGTEVVNNNGSGASTAGQIIYFNVSGGDAACNALLDTDSDGIADYLDYDDDGDGITDAKENLGQDRFECALPALDFFNGIYDASASTGSKGSVGAVYRFGNAVQGYDVLMKVTELTNTTITNIDNDTVDNPNYLQTELTFSGLGTPGATFKFTIVNSGTVIPSTQIFRVNGITWDCDGTTSLKESVIYYNPAAYGVDNPTDLDVVNLGSNNIEMTSGETTVNGFSTLPWLRAYYQFIGNSFTMRMQAIKTTTGSSMRQFGMSFTQCEFLDFNANSLVIITGEDFDGDGNYNHLDLDSDNDGIPDNVEGQTTLGYLAPTGTISSTGIDIAYGTGIVVVDTDKDKVPDFLDLNSDNDSLLDIEENGMANAIITFTDPDNDGIDNLFEGSNFNDPFDVNDEINNPSSSILPDVDGDLLTGGDLDYRDLFDGNPPVSATIDFDGVDDYLSTDSFIEGQGEVSIMAWIKIDSGNIGTTTIAGEDVACKLYLKNGNEPSFSIKTQGNSAIVTSCSGINMNEWHHITGTYSNATGNIKLYVDGKLEKAVTISTTAAKLESTANGNDAFEVGRASTIPYGEYFKGHIDEVRVFNKVLTDNQLQQLVYQEINENASNVRGAIVPKDIIDTGTNIKIPWINLLGYYPMTNIKNNSTADYSTYNRKLTLNYITTVQAQTAPMPYVSSANGNWVNESTWLHGNVWDIENVTTNKDWSIVKISSAVTACHSVKTLGLIIDTGNTFTVHSDNLLQNSWYLELNGTLDLQDDSQLIQTTTSDLVTSATGKLLRRQEGTSNAFRYNYWSSPVGIIGATSLTNNNATTNNPNNTAFTLNMLKDESGFNMQFTSTYNQVGKISTYWLYTFKNGLTYWDWAFLAPTTALNSGIGYTQKGTGNAGLEQQYIFEGKPNNGTILINVTDKGGAGSVPNVSRTEYLFGNPYPSALDIHKFIDDNSGVIDGTLQLWQQWDGDSHYLDEYKGGYAQVNKLGSVRAYQFVGFYGANNGSQDGTKTPSRYLPVGQGFITEIVVSGMVEFNNSQRVFIKEADADGSYTNGSTFFKSANTKSKRKRAIATEKQQDTGIQKIRLEFNSVVGPKTRRELLLGFSETTTDGYDYGYDAECDETNNNDFNLNLEGKSMNMQAYSSIAIDKIIPLNFKSSGNNTFEIRMTELEDLDETQEIYLKDNITGAYFDLRQDAAYSFTSAAGKFNNRFEIVFQPESKLLSTEELKTDENFIYYQNATNTLFGKKLNTSIDKLALVNMRGQTVMEFSNVSQETLNSGIKINNVASGTYVAWFKAQTGQVITKKIIVN